MSGLPGADGAEEVIRTKSGRILTDEDIQALADEAERGYDITKLQEDVVGGWCRAQVRQVNQAFREAKDRAAAWEPRSIPPPPKVVPPVSG